VVNREETVNGETKAGVIAARQRLDIGAKTVTNQEDALLFSDGGLFIGRQLNERHQAEGTADGVHNGSATIESIGDMVIDSKNLANRNNHFSIRHVPINDPTADIQSFQVGTVEKHHEIAAKGDPQRLPFSRFKEVKFGRKGIKGKVTKLVDKAANEYSDADYELGRTPIPDSKMDYSPNSELWRYFGIEPPKGGPKIPSVEKAEKPTALPEGTCDSAHASYNAAACQSYQQAWLNALNEKVAAYNNQFHREIKDYTDFVFERRRYRDQIASSKPGNIRVGGNAQFTGEITNDQSNILIGKQLFGGLERIHNVSMPAFEYVKDNGTRQYTYTRWRGRIRGHKRYWDDKAPYNPPAERHQINLNISDVQENVSVTPNKPTDLYGSGGGQVSPLNVPNARSDQNQNHIQLPINSLYSTQPNNPNYLIETDPAFTNYRRWLGSDYLLAAFDPVNKHKRLGDGYYEQKLVSYDNDEDQLKALMDAGITFARSQQLVPGVALSAAQVAQLTSDIVWLENQTITLKDGSQQTVLVPKVYVVARKGDLNSTGSLISANVLQLNADEIRNGGTIAGRKVVDLRAQNIEHSGQIRGEKVWLDAQNQINLQGGDIAAGKLLSLSADQINASSTTATSGDKQNGNTVVDKVARLSVGEDGSEGGILSIQSQHDTHLNGAVVRNTSQGGKTQIISEHGNVDLGTVATERHESYGSLNDKNHRHVHQTAEVGTDIQSQGDLLVKAGNDIKIRQGNLDSEKGLTALQAGHDIQISEGRSTLDFDESVYTQSKGFLSKRSQLDTYQRQHDEAQGSSVTGKLVYMDAGHDLNVVGSDIVSEQKAQLHAGHNTQLTTAQSYYNDRESHQTKKSGLMGTGGIGFTVGSKQDQFTQTSQVVQQVGSTAGSLNGDALITAGNQYSQIGSTVSTPKGRITIDAAKINIADAKNIQIGESEYVHQQKGLTIALSTPITDLAQQAIDTAKNAKQVGQSKNARVNAMAAANTAMQAYQTGQAINKIQSGKTSATSVGVSITYGEQKNRQTSSSYHTESQASQLLSGAGPVVLMATGQGKDSQINITGSDVIGKGGTHLYADGGINIQAAKNTHSEHSRNSNKGWNAGVSLNFGSGISLGITAGGNKGKGYTDAEQTTYRHSHVGSKEGPTVVMSGGDTNIKGAQVTGKGITVRAANLNIESLQDTADYHSRQQNIKGQVTVGYGASASGDYSKSKINAEHRSVSEQSGLFAGEDGFDVQVGGHTQLTGGIITSAQSAEEQGKNRFQSGSISQTDLHNISKYDGSSIGFGTSVAVSGKSLGQEQQAGKIQLSDVASQNPSGFSSGYGHDSDHQESTTKSGIGTRNIILTDEAGQLAKTGYGTDKAAQLAYTDIRTEDAGQQSGSLKNRFDADKVQNELDLQRNVSQQFSQTVGTAQGMLNEKIDALKQQQEAGEITKADYAQKLKQLQHSQVFLNMVAAALSSPTDSAAGIAAATAAPAISYGIGQEFKKHNKEGSATHIASHMALGAVVSALGGNDAVSGALAAGGAEALVPLFSKAMYGTTDPEKLTAEDKQNLSNMARLLGSAVGAATSNGAANGYADVAQGGMNAGNAVENNSLHPARAEEYMPKIKRLLASNKPEDKVELSKLLYEMQKESENYTRALKNPYGDTRVPSDKKGLEMQMQQLVEAQVTYARAAAQSKKEGNLNAASFYLKLQNEAADDYRMLVGIYNRKETRKVPPIEQKDWSKWRDVGQIGYTQKDKQRDERYTYPVVQTTSGAIKTLAGLVSSPSCATGAGCAGAAYLFVTGIDDTLTGIRNFGKDAQEHEDPIRIQAATAAGVPRKVSVYTDFAIDMAAGAAVSKGGGIAKDIDPPNYSSSGKITGKLNYGWGDLKKSIFPEPEFVTPNGIKIPARDVPEIAMASKGGKNRSGSGKPSNQQTTDARIKNPYGVRQPEAVRVIVQENGQSVDLMYRSHVKHSKSGVGKKEGKVASIEPENSLDLFKKSVSSANTNSNKRFAFDGENFHQFSLSKTEYHWSGTVRREIVPKETRKEIIRKWNEEKNLEKDKS